MAKKDAIFDYGSSFDTTPYLTGVGKDWDNNVGSALDIRFDLNWRGTPRAESHIHSGSSTAAISGWDVGTWKSLSMYDLPLQDYSAYPASNEDGFQSMSHQLIYDVKRAFNLPNQETLSSWKDQYTADDGEHHYLFYQSGSRTEFPMLCNNSSKGGLRMSSGDPMTEKDVKCCLEIPIRGFGFFGGDDNEDNLTVWPTSTDMDAMNDHYATLEAANTPAADWTNPPKVGSEFSQASKLLLLNFENYWMGKRGFPDTATDSVLLCIAWSSHSYAEIKALIDAAIT